MACALAMACGAVASDRVVAAAARRPGAAFRVSAWRRRNLTRWGGRPSVARPAAAANASDAELETPPPSGFDASATARAQTLAEISEKAPPKKEKEEDAAAAAKKSGATSKKKTAKKKASEEDGEGAKKTKTTKTSAKDAAGAKASSTTTKASSAKEKAANANAKTKAKAKAKAPTAAATTPAPSHSPPKKLSKMEQAKAEARAAQAKKKEKEKASKASKGGEKGGVAVGKKKSVLDGEAKAKAKAKAKEKASSSSSGFSFPNPFAKKTLTAKEEARRARVLAAKSKKIKEEVRKKTRGGKLAPYTDYPLDQSGYAGGPKLKPEELKWSPNGNALLQLDRQTITYNQFLRDLSDQQILELHYKREGHDRYFIIYKDDRVAHVEVPQDDFRVAKLCHLQGLEASEIVVEGELDRSTNVGFQQASENQAKVISNYGLPLIGVGVVWFIVWTMNRFKGDFDDRQKILEQERRAEAIKGVDGDPGLETLKNLLKQVDKTTNPEEYKRREKEVDDYREKLERRAAFLVSEEGGGPGGNATPGGAGNAEEAIGKFMKAGGMKVIGKREERRGQDAVGAALDAAAKAKAEDDAAREAKKNPGGASKKVAKQGQLRSKMKMRDESDVVMFSDVAGIGDAKIELAEIVDFFRMPEKFKKSGAQVPKGVMLTGPPGCGKTLLARAVAGESGATFFSLTASEFVEMFVGVGAARVRDLFAQAKKQAPSIIFIDELDAVGRPRGAGGSGNDERDQTLNQLLVELDGFGSDAGVVCIAATNRVDVLDKALVRAGRFDRKITVQPPTREGRLQILKVHVRDKPLNDDVDLIDLAAEMNGFTGAIIANVVNTACLAAAREGRDDVCQRNFDDAVEAEQLGKILPIDRGMDNERRIARVHATCAVGTYLLMHDVCKINFTTITPRETNMDGCVSLKDFPEVDRPGLGIRGVMSRQVRVCYAPQIAEEEEYGFDDLSFAAAPYTARAREIVALMVQASGMAKEGSTLNIVPATDAFSVVDFLRRDVVEFLMRHTTVDKYFASDREAREMLEMEHRAARRFVQRQKAAIDALTEALVEHKTVDLEMMEKIMAEHAVEEPKEEEEIMPYYSPEDRERLVPWEGEMPKDSVPATNEWIET